MFPHGGRAGAHTHACDLGMCVFGTRKSYVTIGILGIPNVQKRAHAGIDVVKRERASPIVKQGVNTGGSAHPAYQFCSNTSHNVSGAMVTFKFYNRFYPSTHFLPPPDFVSKVCAQNF